MIDSPTVVYSIAVITPPTIRDLLQEPEFRAFMKKRPVLPEHLQTGNPWRVWLKTVRNTWIQREFPTYDDAWSQVVAAVRQPEEYADAALVSKRVLYAPPATLALYLDEATWKNMTWCGRCRRPTRWLYTPSGKHHAVRNYPVITYEDAHRCYYCGQRKTSNIYARGKK